MDKQHDPVNSPAHYTQRRCECIEIAEHMSFCRGNALKYLWRAGDKGDAVQDLQKARWYIDREITRINAEQRASQENKKKACLLCDKDTSGLTVYFYYDRFGETYRFCSEKCRKKIKLS